MIIIIILTIASATFTPSTQVANQTTNYQLVITSFTNIDANSKLIIKFPTQYSDRALNTALITWTNDPLDFCPDDCNAATISYQGYEIQIDGLFPFQTLPFMQFTIAGIVNPPVALTTNDLTIEIINPSSTVQYSETVPGITFTTQTMTCSGVVTEDNEINQIGSVSIEFEPISNSPAHPFSSVRIYFPTTWASETLSTQTLTKNVYCTSVSQPSVSCVQTSAYLLISSINYNAKIDVEVHSIHNPTAVIEAGSISVVTLDSSNNEMDRCSFNANGFTSNLLREVSATIWYDSPLLMSLNISFIFPSTVISGDTIEIDVPSTFDLSLGIKDVKIGGVSLGSSPISYSNNKLTVTPFTFTRAQPVIDILSLLFTRPRVSTTSSEFSIRTYRSGNLMSTYKCCSMILEHRESVTMNSATASQPFLLSSSNTYAFNFTTTQTLISTDYLIIEFPFQYSLTTVTCGISAQTALTGTPVCTVAGLTITITSFLAGSASANQEFLLTINNIDNPLDNPSTTPFSITIAAADNNIIDRNRQFYVALSPLTIGSASIASNSYLVANRPTQLTFNVASITSFEPSFFIEVGVPPQLAILTNQLECMINGNIQPCSFSSPTVSITCISSLGILSSFSIDGIVNQDSLEPTGGFSFTIYDELGNTIELSNSSANLAYTLTNPAAFEFISISLSSQYNENGNMNILLGLPFTLNQHYLVVSYNSTQIQLNTGLCTGSISCTFSTSTLEVSNLPSSNLVNISLGPVVAKLPNPTLSFQLKSSTHFDSLSGSGTTSDIVPDAITYTLNQSSWVMGSQANITIEYAINSQVTENISSVVVQVPNQYSTSSPNNLFSFPPTGSVLSINDVTNPSRNHSGAFFVMGLSSTNEIIAISQSNIEFRTVCTYPCETCSTDPTDCLSCYSWQAHSIYFSSVKGQCLDHCPSTYYLQTNTSTCLPCDNNCLTCDYHDPSLCMTCNTGNYLLNGTCYQTCPNSYYPSTTQTKTCVACPSNCDICANETHCTVCKTGIFFYENQCISNCPIKTYELANLCVKCADQNCVHCSSSACLACEASYYLFTGQCFQSCPFGLFPDLDGSCSACECASCSAYSYNCTSCIASQYLLDFVCYSVCPDGTYPSLNVCENCVAPCKSCSSATACSKCEEGTFLYNGGCVNSCPNTTIVTISDLNISSCEVCTSPCLTCDKSTTFCLTCDPTYSFHNNTCVLVCPAPLHSINFFCMSCIASCLSCNETDPNNCTECQPNYYLFNTTCFSSCPSGTYTNLQAKTCVGCLSVCSTCLNATNCTSCIDGYYLFNWNCYTSCPTTPIFYYNYQGHCTPCQPQCVSCINSPIQCTACSDSSYFYNSVTFECSYVCSDPYYPFQSTCIACQAPCSTCDSTYYSCASCSNSLYLYNGSCTSSCPTSFYASVSNNGGVCLKCAFPCLTCLQNQCISCQVYAFLYKTTCVLECPSDQPYQSNGICSNCLGVSFCAVCGQDDKGADVCRECAYPYVLFQDACLNQCPTNYTINTSSAQRECIHSTEYIQYLQELAIFNRPPIFPMFFVVVFVVVALICYVITIQLYEYTYHQGYLIGLLVLIDTLCLYYSMYYIFTRYTGTFIQVDPLLPAYLVCIGLALNSLVITLVYLFCVVKSVYLTDVRYFEWKQEHRCYWWAFIILMPLLGGHRLHKWNYSKVFDWSSTAFRIVSVEKFFPEDILTLCTIFGDIIFLAGMSVCVYNIHLAYNTLFLLGYECLILKLILWVLLFFDLKKPDKGFFKGDEKQAEQELLKEEEEEQNQLKRMNTQNLAKMIRTKSAGDLELPKYFGSVEVDDFISVYDPSDYQDVPRVPLKKIEKNIYKGKFRKGKKITMDEKLNKFLEGLGSYQKPKRKMDSYLKDFLYWKPPVQVKVQKKDFGQSQESMLELLKQKEEEYKDEFDMKEEIKEKKKYNQRNYFEDIDETIPNDTIDFFYPSATIDEASKDPVDYDDLMNLNYAKKKHLINKEPLKGRDESLRVLHHEPKKKRKNPLVGFGNMVLQKYD